MRLGEGIPVEYGAVAGRLSKRIGDFIAVLGVMLGEFFLASLADRLLKLDL